MLLICVKMNLIQSRAFIFFLKFSLRSCHPHGPTEQLFFLEFQHFSSYINNFIQQNLDQYNVMQTMRMVSHHLLFQINIKYQSYQFLFANMKQTFLSLLSFFLIIQLIAASQYVPIGKRYPGIFIGKETAQVHLQLVYDPTCDGSTDFDHTIREVIQGLEAKVLNEVSFRYTMNVLPYHINSFKLASAVRLVQSLKGDQAGLQALRYFLDHINEYDEKSLMKITINQYMDKVAKKVSDYGINQEYAKSQITHYSENEGITRGWAKYAMGTLRTPGTPYISFLFEKMFLNGARVDGVTEMSTADIITLIKSRVSWETRHLIYEDQVELVDRN